MNTTKRAFMTSCPNGRLGKHLFWYAPESGNVLAAPDTMKITSGIPGYKRPRPVKVARKAKFDFRPAWMQQTYFAWVFIGEGITVRCQPTRYRAVSARPILMTKINDTMNGQM